MEKAIRFEKPSEVHVAVGKEICVTDWVTVDQQRIDKFAEATGDHQWIHVDVERAKASPFGGTIAHGFLILSLLPALNRSVPSPQITGHSSALNFGAESLRFTAPVPAGSSVSARTRIAGVTERNGSTLVTTEIAIHVTGSD